MQMLRVLIDTASASAPMSALPSTIEITQLVYVLSAQDALINILEITRQPVAYRSALSC